LSLLTGVKRKFYLETPNGGYWRILLKKSKIERLQKSRQNRCLDVFTAAVLARGDTKVRGHFCETHCGPSRRGEQNASAALKNFVRQPEKDFFNSIGAKRPVTGMSAPDGRADLPNRRTEVAF
jgi:hypothetical protein